MSNLSVTYKEQEKSSRLLALITIIPIKLILMIPQLVVFYIFAIIAEFCMIFGILAVLIMGKYPQGLENIVVGFTRYCWRMTTYMICMTDKYPPFTLQATDYPAELSFEHQATSSRLGALMTIIPIKVILIIPHMVVLMIMGIVLWFAAAIGVLAVLINGRYPHKISEIIKTIFTYHQEVGFYILCLTDKYPSISWKKPSNGIVDQLKNAVNIG